MDHFNRYSYVYLFGALTLAAVVYTITRNDMGRGGLAILLIVAFAISYFTLVRRGHVTPSSPLKRVRRSRAGGRPTVVHFFTDYHAGSLAKRPFTAGVERDYRSHCDFIYIDVNHREGPEAMSELEASLGQFIIFDASGNVVDHVNMPSRAMLDGLLGAPSHQ